MADRTAFMIDCQVLQTPAWHRGMGKYSMELLKGLAKDATFSEQRSIKLLFNKQLPMDDAMLAAVEQSMPDADIVMVDLHTRSEASFLPQQIAKNQVYMDNFVATHCPDATVEFLILSLFLSESASVFPVVAKKIVLVYDLIMLQFFEMYLGLGASTQFFGHFKTLFSADLYLTISETVANDLVTLLGINKESTVSIDGGAIERHTITGYRPEDLPQKPFILMPTGGDFRKNNHRGVRGFERFNAEHDGRYQLVLTSTFAPNIVHELNKSSDSLYFTGNIEEHKLAWLYENCEGVLFPSEYEGLGLPVLEAVDFERPVACSDIPVFREISPRAFYYFDPYNVPQMTEAIKQMVNKTGWSAKRATYQKVRQQHSWARSVKQMAEAIDACQPNPPSAHLVKRAVVAPNLTVDNQLAHFIGLQYPEQAKTSTIEYYYDLGIKPKPVRPHHLAYSVNCHELAEFGADEPARFDEVEYHLANNAGSVHTLVKALAIPATVYLHSPELGWVFELAYKCGYISTGRYEAEAQLARHYNDDSWFVSLLAHSKRVVTYDTSTHDWLQKLAERLPRAADLELQAFPSRALPYKPAGKLNVDHCVGLIIGRNFHGVCNVFDNVLAKWGTSVGYKLFLDGLKEEIYYEELGLEYPNFVPNISSTDYGLDLFMQQIDTYYSYQDPRETTTRFFEDIARAHGTTVVRAD